MTNDWTSAKACIESGSFLEARNEVFHFLHTQCSLDKVSNGLRLIYTDIPHYMQYIQSNLCTRSLCKRV